MEIVNLLCEYQENPIGVGSQAPVFSWTIAGEERNVLQQWYRILVASTEGEIAALHGDVWDTDWVEDSRSVNHVYDGEPLTSSTEYFWSIQLKDSKGKISSPDSNAKFETALLHQKDWKGKWIGDPSPRTNWLSYDLTDPKAPLFRKEIVITKPVDRARAYFSGLGWGELYLNGTKISDRVLDPAPTDYNVSIPYVTHDVTSSLKEGHNAIGMTAGNGWYSEYCWKDAYGAAPKVLLQLHVFYKDGSFECFVTDESWKTTFGPILENRMWGGETYDARLEKSGWDDTGYDDSSWTGVKIKDRSRGLLKSQQMPPVKVMEKVDAHLIVENPIGYSGPGYRFYDMKEFYGGWVKIKVKGKRGSQVRIRYSDRANDDNTIDQSFQKWDRFSKSKNASEQFRPCTDIYYLNGDEHGEIYEPRFTYHPVNYVQIEYNFNEVTLLDVEGRKTYSSVDMSGSFSCSNELYNKIHNAVVQTMKNQLFGIPLDCLNREHWGWIDPATITGTLYSRQYMPLFWKKWLEDIRESQFANGDLPVIAPNYMQLDETDPLWGGTYPYMVRYLYRYFDDRSFLTEHYQSIKRLIDHFDNITCDGIIDEGLFGDHMLPGSEPGKEIFSSEETPKPFLWTGYFYQGCVITAEIAKLLGETADAKRYQAMADSTRQIVNDKWFDAKTGRYAGGSQTSQYYALAIDLVPDKQREMVLSVALNDLKVRHGGNHHTGNTGTTCMIDVLGDMGHADVLHSIINRTSYPGWGYMIANGATTIWESWSTVNTAGCELSMSMWATVDEFFYNEILGIKGPSFYGLDDGMTAAFKHITIAPFIPDDMESASGSIKSVYGRIGSSWYKKDGKTVFEISLPGNTTGTVVLPMMKDNVVYESDTIVWNGQFIKGVMGVESGKITDSGIAFKVSSGKFVFLLDNKELHKQGVT